LKKGAGDKHALLSEGVELADMANYYFAKPQVDRPARFYADVIRAVIIFVETGILRNDEESSR